jgi:hypothetical protein
MVVVGMLCKAFVVVRVASYWLQWRRHASMVLAPYRWISWVVVEEDRV